MCGIAGKAYCRGGGKVEEGLLRAMCDALVHRGPDDEGYYLDGEVGLCMRRLQVIDLASGSQPMANEDRTVWIVFNGEIYNYRQLRQDLEGNGHVLRTASDTETILHLYEELGAGCLHKLDGMFAFAIWDSRKRSLFLARDRLGQKPLYYSCRDGALTFASELRAVLCDGSVDTAVDPQAIDEYLTCLFVPHPRTVFQGVRNLPPGSYAEYSNGELQISRYWEPPQCGLDRETDSARPIGELAEELDSLLVQAVRARLVADVPLGAFLSGGLDSSLIVAIVQQATSDPVRTFSIGFSESSFSELDHARSAAEALGTKHEEFTVSYDIEDLVPRMLDHFGEPFADSSAIPTYHLSKVTRSAVTVALSGDGADEVFGGYRRYRARILADVFNRWPAFMGREMVAAIGGRMREPAAYYGTSIRKKVKRFLEFSAAVRETPSTSWAFFLNGGEKARLYTHDFAASLGRQPGGDRTSEAYLGRLGGRSAGADMMWLDLMTYLPDDILVKVDRMSMACSLEVRSPFLDHRLVEFMAGVPTGHKFRLGQSKILLRTLARKYLPDGILKRAKQGFAVPLAAWLKGELRSWMEDILLSSTCRQRGYFQPAAIARMIDHHLVGRRDYSQQLWALAVLESWLQARNRGV